MTTNLQELERPSLVVFAVVVPGADPGALLARVVGNVEHTFVVRTVLEDFTMLIVMPLLVGVAWFMGVDVQSVFSTCNASNLILSV